MNITNLAWRVLAKIVSKPIVATWIIKRVQKTPYWHLKGYMERFWLFNGYPRDTKNRKYPWIKLSIRVHHILRKDVDRDQHNHPFDARTIILKGWYVEERDDRKPKVILCKAGYTGTINRDDFHRIEEVSDGGVWTMFIIFKFYGNKNWGFNTPNGYVPTEEYQSADSSES
jgi:hypothetical protein